MVSSAVRSLNALSDFGMDPSSNGFSGQQHHPGGAGGGGGYGVNDTLLSADRKEGGGGAEISGRPLMDFKSAFSGEMDGAGKHGDMR